MPSNEKITAFLDGALTPEENAQIEQRIAEDPAFARKVSALELDQSALAAAFDGLAAMAPPYQAPRALKAPRQRWPMVAAAASVALAFVGGYALSNRPHLHDWQTEVAHYQVLYVPDTLTHLAPEPTRLAQEFTRASALLGQTLDPTALAKVDGLTLRRAQVLGFQDQPLIQVAYTEANGTPIAFCIMANTTGKSEALQTGSLLGLATATWQDENGSYLVIGGNDPARIARYATQIRAQNL